MGMSASQARLIALTARMSDTEYEAQQVNQQRLTLSNKMNEVYEMLCNMEVPTPPSKIDYMKTVYKGNMNGNEVSAKVNDDGTVSAFETISNADIVQRGSSAQVGGAIDPAKYLGNARNLTDFVKHNPNDYKEKVEYSKTPFDGDCIEFRVGSYSLVEMVPDENDVLQPKVIRTETVSEPTAWTELEDRMNDTALTENQKYDITNLSIDHYEGTKNVTAFSGNATYVGKDGQEVSGEQIIKDNSNYEKMLSQQFAVANPGGGYTIKTGAEISEGEFFEITDLGAFQTALNSTDVTVGGNPTMSISDAQSKFETDAAWNNAINGLQNTFPDTWEGFTVVVASSTDSTGAVKYSFSFVMTDDLTDNRDGRATLWNYAKGSYEKETGKIPDSDITYDSNGNISTAKFNGQDVAMTTEQVVDEFRYEAAMNKYNSDKAEYDQEQNRLNKQTSIYQRQDKQLELKLTRLDSERNALNTEIEAVKKVIQDSIDRGFKTFSG